MISIELYRFTQGANVWNMTSSKGTYTHNSETYLPTAIGRGELQSTTEPAKNTLQVMLDANHPLAISLLLNVGTTSTALTLYRTINGTAVVAFKGRVAAIQPEKNVLTISVVSLAALMKRQGVRRIASRSCPYALYGERCKANKDTFAVNATITAKNKDTLVLSFQTTYEEGYFVGGMLYCNTKKKAILNHVSGTLTVAGGTDGLTIGDTVTVYPGCPHAFSICETRFNNISNFGGLPFLPMDNPFTSSDAL